MTGQDEGFFQASIPHSHVSPDRFEKLSRTRNDVQNPKGMLEVSDTIARMRIWKHGCGDRRCRAASPQHSHFQRETHTHTHTTPTPSISAHTAFRRHRFPKDKIGSQAFVVQHTLAPPSITARTLTLCYLYGWSAAETCASQPDALKS